MKRTGKKMKRQIFFQALQEKLIKLCSFSKDKLKDLHKQNKFQEFKVV